MSRPLAVGFYQPTPAFLAVREHVAVMDAETCGLVAVVGASDETPRALAETNEMARLFAAAPDLLATLQALIRLWDVDEMEYGVLLEETIRDARRAVARATGEARPS